MEFDGSDSEQAKYLLRTVKEYGNLSSALTELPEILNKIFANEISIEKEKLRKYLTINNIQENEIGGSIDDDVSKNLNGIFANYFVIHDASSPNYESQDFPNDINEASWKFNTLNRYADSKQAHIFINRLGESITQNNFSVPWRATKFESKQLGVISRGNFLHIELIQPRRSDSNGKNGNDAIAPQPGFTDSQLKRLALLYIIASNRKGSWLIPTFHAVLDEGISNGHDDPQNFNLQNWCDQLSGLINEINSN